MKASIKGRATIQYVDLVKHALNNYVSKSYIDDIVFDMKPKVDKISTKVDKYEQ